MIRKEAMAGWKQALLVALAFHIAIFMLFFFCPDCLHKRIKIPPVYHVQLFEAPAPKSKSSPAPKSQVRPRVPKSSPVKKISRPKSKPKKKVQKKTVKKQIKTVKKTQKKAISLKPKKQEKKRPKKTVAKKKPVKKTVQKKTAKKNINEEKRLSRRLKKIEENLKAKKEEELLKKRLASLKKKVGTAGSGAYGRGSSGNDALRRYAGAIWMHVRKNWHFPEELLKRKDLEAIVSIRIDRRGHIMSRQFERRSGFPAFDRSVLKAVTDSDPLPPLPVQLLPGPIEIGIRFNPARMDTIMQ